MSTEDEYGSEEDNSFDEDAVVNRTLTEEDLVNSLFITCDWDRTGEVPVSRLIEYVKFTTSNISENDDDLRNLSYMLDPEGEDKSLTFNLYRDVMLSWIEGLQKRNDTGDTGSEYEDLVLDRKVLIRQVELPEETPREMSSIAESKAALNIDVDSEELQSKVADVQFQNRKLLEENSKLHCQLDSQEEALSHSMEEVKTLRRKIKSLQEIVDLRQETLLENEDLKASIARLQEKSKELSSKISSLERENYALERENYDMDKKIQNLNGVIDTLQSKHEEVVSTTVEYKHKILQLNELKSIQEYQLNKRYTEVGQLQKKIKGLDKTVEDLRLEKDNIQTQLTQSQLELHSLCTRTDNLGLQRNVSDSSDAEEDKEITPPQKLHAYFSCSTPIRPNQSIGLELKEMLDGSKHLPSPLCEREFDEDMVSGVVPLYDDDSDTEEPNRNILSVSFKEDLTMEISKFVDKYKEKQSDILKEVDNFLSMPQEYGDVEISTKFTENLKYETQKLTSKFTSLAKAKEVADKKLRKMQQKIETLKDENKSLRQVAEDSRNLLVESDRDLNNVTDNRLLVLRDKIVSDRAKIKSLEKQLNDKNKDKDKGTTVERVLKMEIQRLKKSNQELTEKCHKFEVKMTGMREETGQCNQALTEQKVKCEELEENLAAAMLARQLDLTEIWRLVQKDVEKECQEEQKNGNYDSAGIKERIAQEIEHLKSQLLKNQTVPVSKPLARPEKLSLYHQCGCFGRRNNSATSSPLVEALNIDFMNGNNLLIPCQSSDLKAKSVINQSQRVCENCGESQAISTDLVKEKSKPSSDNNKKACYIDKSNTSSTSGILDMDYGTPYSSASYDRLDNHIQLDQSNKKDYAHHLWLDWDCDSNQFYDLSVRTTVSGHSSVSFHSCGDHQNLCDTQNNNCNLEEAEEDMVLLRRKSYEAAIANQHSLTDPVQPFPRFRSDSFQAALENGQHSSHPDTDQSSFCNQPYEAVSYLSSHDAGHRHSQSRCSYQGSVLPTCSRKQVCDNDRPEKGSVQHDSSLSESGYSFHTKCDPGHSHSISSYSNVGDLRKISSCPSDLLLSSSVFDVTASKASHIDPPQTKHSIALDFTVNSSYLTCSDSSHNHARCEPIKDLSHPTSIRQSSELPRQSTEFRWRDPQTYYGYSMSSSSMSSNSSMDFSDLCESPTTGRKLSILMEEDVSELDSVLEDKERSLLSPGTLNSQGQPQSVYRSSSYAVPERQNCENSNKENYSFPTDAVRKLTVTSSSDGEQSFTKASDCDKALVSDDRVNKDIAVGDSSRLTVDEKGYNPSEGDVTLDASYTTNLVAKLQKLSFDDACLTKPTVPDAQMDKDVEKVPPKSHPPMTNSLSRIRQDNIVKRREQMKFMRMPDLTESQETNGARVSLPRRSPTPTACQNGSQSSGEEEEDSILPSIPDSFLQKLGLSANQVDEVSTDQLTDQEIENKFTNLALAFKTDKITLEKRLEIQERSRDIAEENVAKEIKGLREAWEKLNHIMFDTQVREVLLKIQKHIDVLEQVTSRLSGRAEVYGAVQQEKRMSRAIEIMLSHVENLRMAHEKEHTELEEARRMIQDSRPFGGSSSLEIGEFGIKGRSHSVCQASALQPRGPRRRVSEVMLPRGTTLSHSASLETISDFGKFQGVLHESPESEEDPKSKFQQIVATTAIKNSIGNSLRRTSLEKQTSSNSSFGSRSREGSVENKNGTSPPMVVKQNSSEEEAYQKGFEQGIKAQIGGKLSSLREQQNSISEKLEEMQDKCEEEENMPVINLKETIVKKFWEVVPEWETASKKLRMIMAGFVFFMALCSIVLSFFPMSQAAVEVYPQYKHMDKPPV